MKLSKFLCHVHHLIGVDRCVGRVIEFIFGWCACQRVHVSVPARIPPPLSPSRRPREVLIHERASTGLVHVRAPKPSLAPHRKASSLHRWLQLQSAALHARGQKCRWVQILCGTASCATLWPISLCPNASMLTM